MLRGMLALTPSETAAALAALSNLVTTATSTFLTTKLSSSRHEQVSFELSEDEVELLLDALPVPAASQSAENSVASAETKLRSSLLTFLGELRKK
jgi:hypothetical protein